MSFDSECVIYFVAKVYSKVYESIHVYYLKFVNRFYLSSVIVLLSIYYIVNIIVIT